MKKIAPTVPVHWRKCGNQEWPPGSSHKAATIWKHALVSMSVLRSKAIMKDGTIFMHVSIARPDRLPTWEELKKVKDEFIGENMAAYHVLPAKKDYVNIHNFCLHLWAPENEGQVANLQNLEREDAL